MGEIKILFSIFSMVMAGILLFDFFDGGGGERLFMVFIIVRFGVIVL